MDIVLNNLIKEVINIAKLASEHILKIYNSDNYNIEIKENNTPLTLADTLSNNIICENLSKLKFFDKNNIPIISEESNIEPYSKRKTWTLYWLVDPLDGTKDFISKTDEFCINIALIENNIPILGVIYAPVFDICYFACKGSGAFKVASGGLIESISTKKPASIPNRFIVSRHHSGQAIKSLLDKFGEDTTIIYCGSAIKFGKIAGGEADCYLRLGPTSEWDTAAGHCIINEAGGHVCQLDGSLLSYNTKDSLLNPPFIVLGDISSPILNSISKII